MGEPERPEYLTTSKLVAAAAHYVAELEAQAVAMREALKELTNTIMQADPRVVVLPQCHTTYGLPICGECLNSDLCRQRPLVLSMNRAIATLSGDVGRALADRVKRLEAVAERTKPLCEAATQLIGEIEKIRTLEGCNEDCRDCPICPKQDICKAKEHLDSRRHDVEGALATLEGGEQE